MKVLPIEALQSRITESELGREWINDPFMAQDIWSLTELGYSEQECRVNGQQNLYFDSFKLDWLKLLTKLTIKASVRERYSLAQVANRVRCLRNLDKFLVKNGYIHAELMTESLLQEFIAQTNGGSRQNVITYAIRLWAEEQWLIVPFTPRPYKLGIPKIETIPEFVLYQVYSNLELFPPPLERLFRLQLVLGCRIGEMLVMPRECLKLEGEQWFVLRWIEKRKHWQFYRIHPLVAELVQAQQRFLDAEFGTDSNFDKLFCTTSSTSKRFKVKPNYKPKILTLSTINSWLRSFSIEANLRDKLGNPFSLTSHMFRRTKASIMAYCEAEDEYIAAVLGHGSLDMLTHYRQRSLERLEKEAKTRGYVDMYGRVTTFKPKKRRYEKLADLLKVSTPLGECHRPTMLGDCQYRYACLSCCHHRVTLEDKPKLEADQKHLQQDLKQAQAAGQDRLVTEINQLLSLINKRLWGLNELNELHSSSEEQSQ